MDDEVRSGAAPDRDGDRWYKDPSNPTRLYAGVTSVLGVRRAPWLEKARLRAVADYAARYRSTLAEARTMTQVRDILLDQSMVLPDWVVARQFGNAIHKVVENLALGRPAAEGVRHVQGTKSYPCDNNFAEWVPPMWEAFLSETGMTVLMCERTVVNDRLGYAGSFDLLMQSAEGHVILVDVKSNKGGPRDSTALQNSAYAHCPQWIDMSSGDRGYMPPVDKSKVLWMRPEGWSLHSLDSSDLPWELFQAHLLCWRMSKGEFGHLLGGREAGGLETPYRRK